MPDDKVAAEPPAGHFPGCHPDDDKDRRGQPAQQAETEACWHCGTPTPTWSCAECQDGADYVPPSAVYHCRACGRWWAYVTPRITTITFGKDGTR